MNDHVLRELVEERWTELEAEQTTGERRLRVAQLPVTAVHGPLSVAVDHDRHRHVLLPVPSQRKIRPGLDGPVLRLRRTALEDQETYQTYADLVCLRDDLNDLFTELCVDVLEATLEQPGSPVKALYHVLDRWRSLFRTRGGLLGPEQQAGLFGELTVLSRLLEKDPSAHRLWRGPEGHRHDFSAQAVAVEVKSSTQAAGRGVRIHGLDQLEAPTGGMLFLARFRLARTDASAGTALTTLVERTLRLCDDESALLDLLARVGYLLSDTDRYAQVRFVVEKERWYRVDADFPGLTSRLLATAGVAISVRDVEYTIDLSDQIPVPLVPDQVARVLDTLVQEFV
ncbi:PD-(D/E)XK motif protein [Streptomyces sp. NPDC059015]|uniref:PD-(D/E)XK motif protein n=1 Tax=unclassified Streptomyces TaxID=2593676 RepID=UPI0036B30BB9